MTEQMQNNRFNFSREWLDWAAETENEYYEGTAMPEESSRYNSSYATFTDKSGETSRLPISQALADSILNDIDRQNKAVSDLMPDERSAIDMLFSAYQRLKDFGWRDIAYCPRDGVAFEAIELGSTGIHNCECSDGDFWISDDADVWPSHPILYREPKNVA